MVTNIIQQQIYSSLGILVDHSASHPEEVEDWILSLALTTCWWDCHHILTDKQYLWSERSFMKNPYEGKDCNDITLKSLRSLPWISHLHFSAVKMFQNSADF